MHQREVLQRLRQLEKHSLDLRTTTRAYDAFRAFVNKFAALLFPWTMAYHADHMALHSSFYAGGRGIVLTAGDKQAPDLLRLVRTLRKLGCELPVEVMYLGDDDIDEEWRLQFETVPDVVTRDLEPMIDDVGWELNGK